MTRTEKRLIRNAIHAAQVLMTDTAAIVEYSDDKEAVKIHAIVKLLSKKLFEAEHQMRSILENG